jgi:hypothetical protein
MRRIVAQRLTGLPHTRQLKNTFPPSILPLPLPMPVAPPVPFSGPTAYPAVLSTGTEEVPLTVTDLCDAEAGEPAREELEDASACDTWDAWEGLSGWRPSWERHLMRISIILTSRRQRPEGRMDG